MTVERLPAAGGVSRAASPPGRSRSGDGESEPHVVLDDLLSLELLLPPPEADASGVRRRQAVNAVARHPHDERRPLIDVGVASFLAPAEMAGALLGVLLNQS